MSTAEKRKRAAFAVLLAVFLISAAMTARQQLQYRKIAADSLEAAQIAGLDRQEPAPRQPIFSPGPEEPDAPPPEPLPEEAASLLAVDLEALRAVNGDVVGWIAIPGTQLSYPLVQGEDNQFYLSHNWKREASSGGSVFLESTNSRDLSNFHTIIYAHRMRDNSMFGTLKYYSDMSFLQEHPSVYLAVGGGICRYDIFSARKAAVDSIVYRLNPEQHGLQNELIQSCIGGSAISTGIVPAADGRILTLSTCNDSGYADRWVVHAVFRAAWTVE